MRAMLARSLTLLVLTLTLPTAAFARNPGASLVTPGAGFPFGPNDPSLTTPHVVLPWNVYGAVLRNIVMPAQPVIIPLPAAGTPGESRMIEIPAYIMTETTLGFFVPSRYVPEQLPDGTYRWGVAPPQFFRK
jgi:hypothetical protein